MSRFLKAWLPVVLMCAVIFLFSQDSSSGRHSSAILGWLLHLVGANTAHNRALLNEPFRKSCHVGVYAILSALAYRAFAYRLPHFNPPAAVRSLVFCCVYACTDEYHQSFIPTRGPSVRDVAIDTMGAALALLLIWAWRRQRNAAPPPLAAIQSA